MGAAKLGLNLAVDKISTTQLRAIKKRNVSTKALLGNWVNCNKTTRGVVKVIIGVRRGVLTVHVFGACYPKPCDWKVVNALAYADNVSSLEAIAFSAFYKFNFKETIVTGHLCNGCLIVETFNHFTDGSGRSNYYSRECFCQK